MIQMDGSKEVDALPPQGGSDESARRDHSLTPNASALQSFNIGLFSNGIIHPPYAHGGMRKYQLNVDMGVTFLDYDNPPDECHAQNIVFVISRA
jgi:hypothetical protein